MKTILIFFCPAILFAQPDIPRLTTTSVVPLQQLVDEALTRNPEIQAALHQMSVLAGRVPQAGGLPDPELTYMREQMAGFRWDEAMMQKFELMQMIRFPSKVSTQVALAEIQTEHAHHDHLEKINEVIARLKSAYGELWYAQQARFFARENLRLLRQFEKIAETRYAVGSAQFQEAVRANVEIAKLENQMLTLDQKERSASAMIASILDRPPGDAIGEAILPEVPVFTPSLDTLQALAMRLRPMLVHDSLNVEEGRTMVTMAKQEYLPDLKLGIQYVTFPAGDFRGWSLVAGITLPFVPWTLGKAGGRVEEATATMYKAGSTYRASRALVLASVRDLYFRVRTAQQQLERTRSNVLPLAKMSLQATLTAYQTGKAEFQMLLDAYRTLVDISLDALMIRMQFEQSLAELERSVGEDDIAYVQTREVGQ